MKTKMSHRTNRRRLLQATAGSSIGLWMSGAVAGRSDINGRRETPESAAESNALGPSGGVAKKFWIDPSIAAWPPGPWRKVHIEYHTSRHMPKLAERFDADEFGDQLLAAHINGATVFAKDMYGYCYYPSSLGPMHP